jgi:peptide/nickel transport system substrate-binding protein
VGVVDVAMVGGVGRLASRGRARRALVAGAALGGLVGPGMVVVGTSPPAAAASSKVNPHGVLTYGFDLNNEFSNNFDPGDPQSNDCSYTVLANIYQSMTVPGNFQVTGGVAQSWTVSNNSSLITFHLRPGMVFSNGQPVTAADVKASMEHIAKSPLRSSLTAIASIATPNPETVVVTLNRPTAGDFLWAMSYLDGSVMPASLATGDGLHDAAVLHPIGAGPFMLKSYSQGASIDLVKNPRYWNSKAYPLGGVDFVQLTNGPQAVTALTSGAVDMIQVEPENYPQLKHDANVGISVTKSYDNMAIELRQNTGPFTNEKVRAALEYAVDRVALNKVVFDGLGQPAYQSVPSWSPGYSKSLGAFDAYNPTKAKAMLKAAGFPHGVTFTMIMPSGDATFARAAALVQAEMARAGFHANLQQIPGSDFLTDVYIKGEGDALLTLLLTNGADMSNNFESLFEPTGFPAQRLGSINNTLTPLIERSNSSLSASVQGPLMQEMDRTILTQGLVVPLVFEPSIVAYNKQRVGGNVVAPIGQCRSNLAGVYIKK